MYQAKIDFGGRLRAMLSVADHSSVSIFSTMFSTELKRAILRGTSFHIKVSYASDLGTTEKIIFPALLKKVSFEYQLELVYLRIVLSTHLLLFLIHLSHSFTSHTPLSIIGRLIE